MIADSGTGEKFVYTLYITHYNPTTKDLAAMPSSQVSLRPRANILMLRTRLRLMNDHRRDHRDDGIPAKSSQNVNNQEAFHTQTHKTKLKMKNIPGTQLPSSSQLSIQHQYLSSFKLGLRDLRVSTNTEAAQNDIQQPQNDGFDEIVNWMQDPPSHQEYIYERPE